MNTTEMTEITNSTAEAADNTPALPTEEKTTATATTSAWVCPDFKISGVFSSHMVLQREKPIKIWGFSDTPGSRVAGAFMGETVTATVGEDNRWTLTFSSHLTECDPQIMVISDDRGHTVTLEDILIGDVWLIGGQSNAELNLAPCMALTPSMDFYEGDNFRLFTQTQAYPYTHQELCATPQPDIINPEPSAIIGGGNGVSPMAYVKDSIRVIKEIYPDIMVEQAAGITNGQQVYDFIMAGSEAAGAASGIMNAADPIAMIDEMIAATRRAADDLKKQEA